MELNGDGRPDILSGSYSRTGAESMAGLFQVLWGTEGGGFRKPEVLNGSDDKPLIIPAEGDNNVRRICTRPMVVDWNGDGDLDLVSGNFEGGFFLFRGEGDGRFAPVAEPLQSDAGELRIAGAHSDPFPVDWDGDGDLDLLSGSSEGGVQWAENTAGPGKQPALKPFRTLVAAPAARDPEVEFRDVLPDSPSTSTRVWAADVTGDGRLDLLVGDATVLTRAADGLDREQFDRRMAEWNARMKELSERMQRSRRNDAGELDEKLYREFSNHYQARSEILVETRTGFVWLYARK